MQLPSSSNTFTIHKVGLAGAKRLDTELSQLRVFSRIGDGDGDKRERHKYSRCVFVGESGVSTDSLNLYS
jgi:hypothetical protein